MPLPRITTVSRTASVNGPSVKFKIVGVLGSLFLIPDGLGSKLDGWVDAGWPSGRPE